MEATTLNTPLDTVTALPNVGWSDLVAQREPLLRFARRRLHDPMLAEDVVHDVFEAVLSGRAIFAGRAALRTWLTGILKHKIVDLIRQRAQTTSLDDDKEDSAPGDQAVACTQPGPEELVHHRQQLACTLQRIEALPPGLRDVVRLRLLEEEPTESVCKALKISEVNLFVRLHRARRLLAA